MAMRETEIAWAAGFFDGEGCTSKTSPGYPMMTVAQNTEVPLLRFREAIGGFGIVRPESYSRNRGHYFTWRLTRWQDVRKVHAVLWPYLCSVKKEQAIAVWDQFDAWRAENPNIGQGRSFGRKGPKLSTVLAGGGHN